ncbi:MAG: addiction module protein [Gallionellaceae bacterium]
MPGIAILDEDSDIEEAWEAETERRIAEIEAGTVQLIPATEVIASVRAALLGANRYAIFHIMSYNTSSRTEFRVSPGRTNDSDRATGKQKLNHLIQLAI